MVSNISAAWELAKLLRIVTARTKQQAFSFDNIHIRKSKEGVPKMVNFITGFMITFGLYSKFNNHRTTPSVFLRE